MNPIRQLEAEAERLHAYLVGLNPSMVEFGLGDLGAAHRWDQLQKQIQHLRLASGLRHKTSIQAHRNKSLR